MLFRKRGGTIRSFCLYVHFSSTVGVNMRSKSYLAVAAFAAMACSESPVAPEAAVLGGTTANASGYRPPPPLETIGEAAIEGQIFSVATTYFLNPAGNNGFISFGTQIDTRVTLSSPSARITYHFGTLSGQGTLTLTGATTTYRVDLATGLDGANLFGTCAFSCGSFDFTASKYIGGNYAGTAKGNVYLRNPAFRGGDEVCVSCVGDGIVIVPITKKGR